jgi:hypothetical protein
MRVKTLKKVRCEGTTLKGNRCKRMTTEPSHLCASHKPHIIPNHLVQLQKKRDKIQMECDKVHPKCQSCGMSAVNHGLCDTNEIQFARVRHRYVPAER